jgi:2-polyprenyl-6-methoxyphenol hydroxylase-like FAD-dependent oxidoreductase
VSGRTPHVLIVGAGPAGATLAYLLARRGIRVTLLERHRDFEREFRGEVLMPSALDAFAQMGLAAQVAGIPQVGITGAEGYLQGERFLRVRFEAHSFGGATPVWISQPALLEMLVAEAGAFENFRFERAAVTRALLREAGRVCGARVELDGEDVELRADLVIGADGRASIVRRDLAVEVRRDRIEMDVVWLKLPLPDFAAKDPCLRAYLGRAHFAIAGPTPDDALQIGWVIRKGQFGALRERGIEQWLDELASHVSPELGAHFRACRDRISRPFLLDVVADRVSPWSRPGALLIGDAAHTMSPVGAQGINIAVRDALVAANHLVPALRERDLPDGLDRAGHQIEHERRPEVRTIQRLQSIPPRIVLRDAWWVSPLIRWLPRLLVGETARGPVVRRFAQGVTDVKLRV